MIQNKNFIKMLLLLTAILLVAIYTINNFDLIKLPSVLYGVVLGMAIFTYFAYRHMSTVRSKMFVNGFMSVMGIKMFGSLVFLAIYLFIDSSQKYEVAFGLFAIYLAFNFLLLSSIQKIKPNVDL